MHILLRLSNTTLAFKTNRKNYLHIFLLEESIKMSGLTEKKLLDTAGNVGEKEWKKLGLLLQFSWTEVNRFLQDNKGSPLTEIVFRMLVEWHKKFKDEQQLENLEVTLSKCRHMASKSSTVDQLQVSGTDMDDLFLYRLGELVGSNWKILGQKLEIENGTLEHIQQDNSHNSTDAAMETLLKWKRVNSGKPGLDCFSRLLRSLKKVGLVQLANSIRQFHRQHIKPEDLEFQKDDRGREIVLGVGAYSRVLRATYNSEDVAVKIIQDGSPLLQEEQKKFLKEIENLSEIQGSHTVDLYGMLIDDDKYRYAVVMEFVPNGSLQDVLEKVDLPYEIKTKIAIDLLQSVSFIHKKGMIHGDIKSGNLLLDSAFKVRLSDFGQASLVHLASTKSRTLLGTPTHRSPESVHPDLSKGYPADTWSCGITLYELFAEKHRDTSETFKRLPFNEGTTTEEIIASLILKKRPISAEQVKDKIADDCPQIFLSVMQRATEYNPADRPKPLALAKELKNFFKKSYATTFKQKLEETYQNLQQSQQGIQLNVGDALTG